MGALRIGHLDSRTTCGTDVRSLARTVWFQTTSFRWFHLNPRSPRNSGSSMDVHIDSRWFCYPSSVPFTRQQSRPVNVVRAKVKRTTLRGASVGSSSYRRMGTCGEQGLFRTQLNGVQYNATLLSSTKAALSRHTLIYGSCLCTNSNISVGG